MRTSAIIRESATSTSREGATADKDQRRPSILLTKMIQQTVKKAHYLHLKIEQKKGISNSMFNNRGYRIMGI